MSHYENLGVSETATANEIKRAYRGKAKDHHPDKGGDHAQFASIAHAYEVLKDPVRRQLYDSTGQDQRKPIDIEVQGILLALFTEALAVEEDIEIIATVRNSITGKFTEEIPTARKKLKARRKKLKLKRGKIKSKRGTENLAHMIIDGELKGIEAQLVNLDHYEAVGKACLAALKNYSEESDNPPPVRFRGTILSYG